MGRVRRWVERAIRRASDVIADGEDDLDEHLNEDELTPRSSNDADSESSIQWSPRTPRTPRSHTDTSILHFLFSKKENQEEGDFPEDLVDKELSIHPEEVKQDLLRHLVSTQAQLKTLESETNIDEIIQSVEEPETATLSALEHLDLIVQVETLAEQVNFKIFTFILINIFIIIIPLIIIYYIL